MLKNVEIRNFRCFQKAVLARLSRYNIIVGDNSSGKTALLEALFLMSSSNPEVSLRNNIWRGVSNSKAEFTAQHFKSLWKDMFYSLDEDARISIAGQEQVGRNYRKLEVYLDKTAVSRPVKVEEDPSLIESIRPVNFMWTLGRSNTHVVKIDIDDEGSIRVKGTVPGSPVAFLSASNPHPRDDIARFDALQKKKRQRELGDAISDLFPEIVSLSMGLHLGQNRVFADIKSLQETVPIGLYSAGVKKLISILLALTDTRHGMLLIDEIENGFYYDRYKDVWKYLLDWSSGTHFDCQLFVSSHSLECLKALQPIVDSSPHEFSLIKVRRKEERSTLHVFGGEDFKATLEQGFDVR